MASKTIGNALLEDFQSFFNTGIKISMKPILEAKKYLVGNTTIELLSGDNVNKEGTVSNTVVHRPMITSVGFLVMKKQ